MMLFYPVNTGLNRIRCGLGVYGILFEEPDLIDGSHYF